MNRSHAMPTFADARGSRLRPQHAYRAYTVEESDPAKSPALKSLRRDAARRAEAEEEIRALMSTPRSPR